MKIRVMNRVTASILHETYLASLGARVMQMYDYRKEWLEKARESKSSYDDVNLIFRKQQIACAKDCHRKLMIAVCELKAALKSANDRAA